MVRWFLEEEICMVGVTARGVMVRLVHVSLLLIGIGKVLECSTTASRTAILNQKCDEKHCSNDI
ncbi:MAG: hypothetical protein CL912_12120 [Deltaproteobacteria bacterium]|nr:hypothetical protein [Deltaproteobacteria bacterium]